MGADEGETSEEASLGWAANCARHLSTISPLAAADADTDAAADQNRCNMT